MRTLTQEVSELSGLVMMRMNSSQEPVANLAEAAASESLADAIRWGESGASLAAHRTFRELGWTPAEIHTKEMAIRKDHSETFGVSVAFLLSEQFTQLAQDITGKENPSFYEIGDGTRSTVY